MKLGKKLVIEKIREGDLFINEMSDYFILKVIDTDNTGTPLIKLNKQIRFIKFSYNKDNKLTSKKVELLTYKKFVALYDNEQRASFRECKQVQAGEESE